VLVLAVTLVAALALAVAAAAWGVAGAGVRSAALTRTHANAATPSTTATATASPATLRSGVDLAADTRCISGTLADLSACRAVLSNRIRRPANAGGRTLARL
jgi:hypothetical protein